MKLLTAESILFFQRRPEAFRLWEEVLAPWLEQQFPEAEMKVQKTQITLKGRIGFLAISIPPGKLAAGDRSAILLTFGLNRTIAWSRIVAAVPISPHRITYHTLVHGPEDLDEALLTYLEEAWEMANRSKRR